MKLLSDACNGKNRITGRQNGETMYVDAVCELG